MTQRSMIKSIPQSLGVVCICVVLFGLSLMIARGGRLLAADDFTNRAKSQLRLFAADDFTNRAKSQLRLFAADDFTNRAKSQLRLFAADDFTNQPHRG